MADEQNGGNGGAGGGDGAPKYVTAEDVQRMVNGALASQKKDISKLTESFTAQLGELTKTLTAAKPAEADDKGGGEDEKRSAGKRIKDLEALVKANADELAKVNDARAKAEAKARQRREEGVFSAAWQKAGLDTGFAGDVLARLRVNGEIRVDEDEDVYVGEERIDDWAKKLATSDDGKRYQPPRATGAAGMGGPAKTPAQNGTMSVQEARGIFARAMIGTGKAQGEP
jgi:hypothetical protein